MAFKFVPLLRAAALVSAVAFIPATTAGLAAVDARSGPEFGKLMAVYERIKTSYVEPVDDDKLIKGAINGMLAALDPHSSYLDARDFENLRTQTDGSYGGLGLSVTMDDGAVKVIAPTKGSPADAAGVKAGDYITHINGKLIYGGTLDEAVDQMRGPPGTSIGLTLFRTGRDEPIEVKITRQIIELKPVDWKVENNIGVISVSSFSANVGSEVLDAFKQIKAKTNGRIGGLVLDLRGNPGGLLDQAIVSDREEAVGQCKVLDVGQRDIVHLITEVVAVGLDHGLGLGECHPVVCLVEVEINNPAR